jgi:hypothetical protein
MGRCTRTIGQRRLGRTIHKLENSVEFSSAECKAKMSEKKCKEKTQAAMGYGNDSPIQNLRDASNYKREQNKI